jgi:hypothetical protein
MGINELLTRARSQRGRSIFYDLGAGGMVPTADTAANHENRCDCSGYVCWSLGISRHSAHPFYVHLNDGWINTDAIVADAEETVGFFRRLESPAVGCLIVFPSGKPSPKVGHVGIVTVVGAGTGMAAVRSVIHCSSGNYRQFHDAVHETPPTVFDRPTAIFAWYEGIAPDS